MFRKVKGAGGGSDGDEDEDEDLDEDFNEDEAEAENESDAAFLRYVCATTNVLQTTDYGDSFRIKT